MMCGRFTLKTPAAELARFFATVDVPQLSPRYNIAPTQPVVCIRAIAGDTRHREATELRWGLIPAWAKDASAAARMINARSETAAEKPAFRQAFASRRCLIPADGFYEWQKQPDGTRQPWFIQHPDERPIAFAGLWESWRPSGSSETVESCTILTTQASADLRELHERMPVILPAEQQIAWLNGMSEVGQLQQLMRSLSPGSLIRHPVATIVNKVGNDRPECLLPVGLPDDNAASAPRQRTLFD